MRPRDYVTLGLFAILLVGLIAIKAVSITTVLWGIWVLSSLFLVGIHFLASYLAFGRHFMLGAVVFLVPIGPTVFLLCNLKKYKLLLGIQVILISLFYLTKAILKVEV